MWLSVAFLNFAIAVLNNLALEYQISVPLHIVLRSGGGLITLIIGTLAGKTYSKTQWSSVATMTLGVAISGWNLAKDPVSNSIFVRRNR
jgi:UDP-xylose/UDP-N-acetylglucosamine transporter B4